MEELDKYAREQFTHYQERLDKQRDDLLALEHYSERYIPI